MFRASIVRQPRVFRGAIGPLAMFRASIVRQPRAFRGAIGIFVPSLFPTNNKVSETNRHYSNVRVNNPSMAPKKSVNVSEQPFKKLMAANRGEIATRISRAASELGVSTVGIYSLEDRFTQHRYKADQAFQLDQSKSPVAQYLDIDTIVKICVSNDVEAAHPGYGFLSENMTFAKKLRENGIVFVGPTVENLDHFGNKATARNMAIAANVPVVAGSEEAFETVKQAREWIADPTNNCSYPVIAKALMGGGGRGIRVVLTEADLEAMFTQASNEALTAFGNGKCFVEKYVDTPRHIEVQCLGDGTGNVIHLWDRDCSVQRRHQKVVECAPAQNLPGKTREKILHDAVALLKSDNYLNAGTVEFLVDKKGQHYFMEVNPRVQVEHTVTEEVTGIDIVQSQILIASGKSLSDLKLAQENIPEPNGFANPLNALYGPIMLLITGVITDFCFRTSVATALKINGGQSPNPNRSGYDTYESITQIAFGNIGYLFSMYC